MVGPANIIASAPRPSAGGVYPRAAECSSYGYGSAYGGASLRHDTAAAAAAAHGTSRYPNTAAAATNIRAAGRPSSVAVGRSSRSAWAAAPAPTYGAYSRPAEQARALSAWEASRQDEAAAAAGARAGGGYGASSNAALYRPARLGTSSVSGLLPSQQPSRAPHTRVTLVLDLDETLVHSSFEPCEADLHIPVHMDGERYTAYVKKRPYVEEFLRRCVELFDVVIWTASLAVYAEPLIDELCRRARCGNLPRMYRDSCSQLPDGGYVKDLTKMNRCLSGVCILDNSPSVARLQPKNLIQIVSWYDDPLDTCLRQLALHLDRLAKGPCVREVIPTLPLGISQ
eukprot:Rhum_TRINITY_DN14819_c8_g2::Rhum_TRINITY_DN14819_c8_g2_i1::g.120860::m.120860